MATLDQKVPQPETRFESLSRWFMQPRVIIRVVLYSITVLYLRTVLFDYVYDDSFLILLNPWMESWKAVPAFFTHTFWGFLEIPRAIDFYRPLVMLVLALVRHLLGPAPGWFHLVATGMHVLATYLVYRLVCETTDDNLVAAIAAGIFGLHPTKVETVAWISGISDSLSAVFFLAAMIAYFEWRKGKGLRPRVLSVAFLLLALFSKEAAIFAPVLVLIYEFSAAESGFTRRCVTALRAVWPLATVTAFAIATRLVLLRNSPAPTINRVPVLTTLLIAPQAVLWYVGKQIWPLGLSIHYPIRVVDQPLLPGFVLPVLFLIGLFAIVIWRVRSRPIGIFYANWFVVMIAPAVLYHNNLQEHDRYFYFGSIATSVALAYLIVQVTRPYLQPRAAIIWILFAALAFLTFNYESYWDNDVKLFTRAAKIAPKNPNVVDYLASVYAGQRDFAKAEAVAQTLIADSRLEPQVRAHGWYTYGAVKATEGHYEEARTAMQNAVQLTHDRNLMLNSGLAAMDLKVGDNLEAAAIYQQEIEKYPKVAYLHSSLAAALTGLGKADDAQREREIGKGLQ